MISAKEAVRKAYNRGFEDCMTCLSPRNGTWIITERRNVKKCSECGSKMFMPAKKRFCPDCGALMGGENDRR